MSLLETLAGLSDELDKLGAVKEANELDELIQEVARREKEEVEDIEANLTFCPACEGSGAGVDEPWCQACKGTGFIALKEAALDKVSFVRKIGNKWCVLSKKKKKLGCYKTKEEANKRLRQVEFFKHQK